MFLSLTPAVQITLIICISLVGLSLLSFVEKALGLNKNDKEKK